MKPEAVEKEVQQKDDDLSNAATTDTIQMQTATADTIPTQSATFISPFIPAVADDFSSAKKGLMRVSLIYCQSMLREWKTMTLSPVKYNQS
jgi:hypothetical protein